MKKFVISLTDVSLIVLWIILVISMHQLEPTVREFLYTIFFGVILTLILAFIVMLPIVAADHTIRLGKKIVEQWRSKNVKRDKKNHTLKEVASDSR